MNALNRAFWETTPLTEMTKDQWESLCDGCGKCCLQKFIDDETDELVYTNIACQLLDRSSCQCSDYSQRKQRVPDCTQLTVADIDQFDWLPVSCSYRLVAMGLPLPEWHHLLTGDRDSIKAAGMSVANRCVSELDVSEDDIETHIIQWVN
ncbi:MAG: YcgN family cysteine cluster protein [Pseudomonadales bacterium]|jgi:uncharacterized cysteine cluster protein YcgN (CxxCxxCC family)